MFSVFFSSSWKAGVLISAHWATEGVTISTFSKPSGYPAAASNCFASAMSASLSAR